MFIFDFLNITLIFPALKKDTLMTHQTSEFPVSVLICLHYKSLIILFHMNKLFEEYEEIYRSENLTKIIKQKIHSGNHFC